MLGQRILFVNTDERHSRGATERMISRNEVAVWGSKGRQRQALLTALRSTGSVVYAYQSGVGVVARGVLVDRQVVQAESPDPVFPQCVDGDSWRVRVVWERLPKGKIPVTDSMSLEATGEKVSNPRAIYKKQSVALSRYLDGIWGIKRPLVRGLLAHPRDYDLVQAIKHISEDTWTLPAGELCPGDFVVFWKAKWRSSQRGVVALGEVLQAPQIRPVHPDSIPFFPGGAPTGDARRILLRYIVPPNFPLWLDPREHPALENTTLAGGQGTKLYRISPSDWEYILDAGGGFPVPHSDGEADSSALEDGVERLLARGKIARPSYIQAPSSQLPNQGQGGGRRYRRADVKAWVLQQADGTCECCGSLGPFLTRMGTPFLEVHHVKRLADDGPDTVENCVAVCPNCHRWLHSKEHGPQVKKNLYSTIRRLIQF